MSPWFHRNARKKSLVHRRWLSFADIRRTRFKKAIIADVERKVFSEKFFDNLTSTYREKEKRLWKVRLANVALHLVLFVQIFSGGPELSIIGIKLSADGPAREGMLLTSSLLSLISTILTLDVEHRRALLTANIELAAPPALRVFAQQNLDTFLGEMPDLLKPEKSSLFPSTFHNFFRYFVASMVGGYVAALVPIGFMMQAAIVYSIASKPALPWYWTSLTVALYVIGVVASALVSLLIKMPLPYDDYSLVNKLSQIQKQRPDTYRRNLLRISRARKRKI